jgi:hypothetical protein
MLFLEVKRLIPAIPLFGGEEFNEYYDETQEYLFLDKNGVSYLNKE